MPRVGTVSHDDICMSILDMLVTELCLQSCTCRQHEKLAVMHSYTAIIIYSAYSFAYNQQYVCLYSAGLNDYAAD